jgi:benzoate-CoA ligase family protein
LDLPRRASGRQFNMAEPLVDRHVAEGRGGRVALRLSDRTVTYAELQSLVNRAGNALSASGIQPEQRIGILLPDGVEFVAAFIGAMKIGAVPVPLNTAARPAELEYMLADCRARLVVRDGTPLQHQSSELTAYATGVDEPCYWLYSSGTTGRPKGVVHLHGDMLACVTPYAEEVLRVEPEDSCFSVARLFFSYGLVNSLFLPLLCGASAVLTAQRPDVAHTLEILRAFSPSLFFSVPSSYAQLCASGQRDAFTSLRFAVSAGEPLPEPLYKRWTGQTGVEVLDGLGSTEVGYIFCSNVPGAVRPGSSGRMLGDHQARIVDERGGDLPDGSPGELWVSCASTALHYWNLRERTKRTFVGEWLRTGDRYVRDAEGYLWYQSRIDDVFKVNGQWVSPLEVESCLLQHPSVLECAVVAFTDADGLVKPKAFVVCRGLCSAAELQEFVRERLQPHNYPRVVEFVEELPKTASGKVQRFALRDDQAARSAH